MSRRRELFVPPIVLDRSNGVPVHRRIYRQIAESIRSGAIQRGVRLPSSRMMARLLGVSRNTVLAAYDDLAMNGLLHGERGSGMRVQGLAEAGGAAWFGLQHIIRSASYPARVLAFADSDGNPLYIRY